MLAFHTQLSGTCCHPTCSTEFHMETDGNGFIQYTQNICLTLSKHEEQEVFHWYPISWTPCQPYHYGIASKTCHTSNNDVLSSLNTYIYKYDMHTSSYQLYILDRNWPCEGIPNFKTHAYRVLGYILLFV